MVIDLSEGSVAQGRLTMRRLTGVVLVASLFLSGCSILFMEKRPADWKPPAPLHCTSTTGWALWDSLVVIGSGVGTAIMVKTASDTINNGGEMDVRFPVIATVLGGLVHLVSAAYGFEHASSCSRAREQEDEFLAQEAAEQARPQRPLPP